ncbi:enolase C-terminal domain-like protein [Promicromonospora iranensis]|uniref:glucarate dehydratase n=1 Tax=Promicromonospora iranensis TaxID=1105144 RepID=A0ABU2CLW2_9MICO|nr:enolase C-terminal domain-like protein [Promicromonospora iranensis]MDR7382329.1 glucarate dehydratase [Promicromonospora iranensis]
MSTTSTIREVRITPVALPDPPLLNVWGVHAPWALRTFVEVVTDDGTVGLGEAQGGLAALERLERAARAAVGTDVRDTTALEARVRAALSGTAERPLLTAFSPLEVACLDAHGRLDDVPCVELLGGPHRDQVELTGYLFFKWAGQPGPDGTTVPDAWGPILDADSLVTSARALVAKYGFRSLKLKGGVLPPEDEIACIRALRDALPGVLLRLDPNNAWTLPTARAASAELTGLLEYLEDPTPCGSDMARLAAETALPLATNMCVAEEAQIGPALADGSVDVLLADHHYWGGLRRTVAIARRCGEIGWGVSLHSNTHLGVSLAAMAHMGAAIGNLTHAGDTHYPWTAEHDVLVPGDIAIKDGAVAVPAGPGLGVRLDPERLAAAHEAYLSCGFRERGDTAWMRTVQPDFDPSVPRW